MVAGRPAPQRYAAGDALTLRSADDDALLHRLRHVEIARARDELKVLHAALLAADEEKSQIVLRLGDWSRTGASTGLANRPGLLDRACLSG